MQQNMWTIFELESNEQSLIIIWYSDEHLSYEEI